MTRRVYRLLTSRLEIWSSRHHRKGLRVRTASTQKRRVEKRLQCLWMPGQLNWWIGSIFALGSLLFAVGKCTELVTGAVRAAWSLDSTEINAIFFAGSIPFTIAAYLQLYQAANAVTVTKGSGLTPGNALRLAAP